MEPTPPHPDDPVDPEDSAEPPEPDPVEPILPDDDLPSLEDSLSLLKRAQAGDDDALNDLLARYFERVRRIVRFRMSPRLRAHMESCDLAQNTLRIAAAKIGSFQPRDRSSIIKWLKVIAQRQINDAADKLNAARHIEALPLDPDASGPGQAAAAPGPSPTVYLTRKEMQDLYDDCVLHLSEDFREIVLLRDYEEVPWDEVRTMVGAPTMGAAHQKYYRAKVRLMKMFQERMGG